MFCNVNYILFRYSVLDTSLFSKKKHETDCPNSAQLECTFNDTLNIEPIRDFIHQLTAKFFANCPSHPNHLVQQIGNYTLDDLNSLYTTYKHKRPKHILL